MLIAKVTTEDTPEFFTKHLKNTLCIEQNGISVLVQSDQDHYTLHSTHSILTHFLYKRMFFQQSRELFSKL